MYISSKKKRRIPRRTVLFLSVILIVLTVLITGTVMFLTKGKDIKDSLVQMPFKSGDPYLSVGGNIAYADGAMLSCIDASQKDVWKAELFSDGLKYSTNGTYIAAVSDTVIMLIGPGGENLFSKQINGTISSVRLGKDKVAVRADQQSADKILSYIIIFDKSGNSVFRIDNLEGKYVLDYGFDTEGEQFYTLELDVSGAAPVSRITTYVPDAEKMTGIKELKDQLVEKIYIGEQAIFTMGTNRLSQYSSLNKDAKDVLVYGWVLEDVCEQASPSFVYVRSSESLYFDIARVISAAGDEAAINLPPGVFKILHGGERIYCFASNAIFVYTGDGQYLRSFDLPFEIDGVRRADSSHVFLTAGEAVYYLPLPK